MKHLKDFKNYSINEYLHQRENWLLQYLNSSEQDKYVNLVYTNPYGLKEYILENDYELDNYFTEDEKDNLINLCNSDIEDYEVVDKISNKEFLEEFGRYVENVMRSSGMGEELPTQFFFDDGGIVKKQWLVHLTDYASDIGKMVLHMVQMKYIIWV